MGGSYFNSEEEANEWLDFDADAEECDRRDFAESDRYAEWIQWRFAFDATQLLGPPTA